MKALTGKEKKKKGPGEKGPWPGKKREGVS